MMNAGRCPRCHKFLIEEQRETHSCQISVGDVQEIVLDYMTDGCKDENGDIVKVAWGLDGILYRLILCKHNPPHSTKRPFTGCGTKQGLDSPSKTAVVPSRLIGSRASSVTCRLMGWREDCISDAIRPQMVQLSGFSRMGLAYELVV